MKAKQSFINAGYQKAEVEAAAQKVPAATQQIAKPIAARIPEKVTTKPVAQPQQLTTATAPNQSKKLSKTFIIILIVSSALVLIGAAILGLFWNTWFP